MDEDEFKSDLPPELQSEIDKLEYEMNAKTDGEFNYQFILGAHADHIKKLIDAIITINKTLPKHNAISLANHANVVYTWTKLNVLRRWVIGLTISNLILIGMVINLSIK